MISIRGIGWLYAGKYGCVRRAESNMADEATALGKGLFSYPFKNFGRLDIISRHVCYAVALAMKDAGIAYNMGHKQDIGIAGTNANGSLTADGLYFRDYLDGGRTLGRGNLFIYTLPSSPLGEAAIHFGLLGPLFYVTGGEDSLVRAMTISEDMIMQSEARSMLVGMADEEHAMYFVIGVDAGHKESPLRVTRAVETLAKGLTFPETIRELSNAYKEAGNQ